MTEQGLIGMEENHENHRSYSRMKLDIYR